MPLNIYPRLRSRAPTLLACTDNIDAVRNAFLQWNAADLEMAGRGPPAPARSVAAGE